MAKKNSQSKGLPAFETTYRSLYGESRWPLLKEALLQPTQPQAWKNPWHEIHTELKSEYLLDPASLIAASALIPYLKSDHLDLCAAPGGKALLHLEALFKQHTEPFSKLKITLNERSPDRFFRLKKVLSEYVPKTLLQHIQLTQFDSRRWLFKEKNAYDTILLDAPCSSERHVLHSPKHLAEWTPKRTHRHAVDQWTLLASALEVVRPGGVILYSTCSLSPLENDGVMSRLLEKRPHQAKLLVPEQLPSWEGVEIENTLLGFQILPDRSRGSGPIFFSLVQRL